MRKGQYKKLILLSILIILILNLLLSCATVFSKLKVIVPKDSELTKGEVENKIPLIVGLYLKPHIKNYTYEGKSLDKMYYFTTIHIGEAFSANSEKMLKNIFQQVVIIDQMDTDLSEKNIDVIVAPEILDITSQFKVPAGEKSRKLVSQMTIRWDIGSPDGKIIYTTMIMGEAIVKFLKRWTVSANEELEKENMLRLLKDQFSKAQEDIYSNKWWKNQWWKGRDLNN